MKELLDKWTVLASHYIGEHFDQCKPYLDKDHQGMDPLVRFVSTQLYLACHFSTESSLILLRNAQEWDADILNRSVTEGVIKYVYMLQGSDEGVLEKVREYWEILPNYAAVKRSERAHAMLSLVDGYGAPEWRGIEDLALSDDDIQKLRHGTNKKSRSLLSQKWSFSEILNCFAKSDNKGLTALAQLAYGYGMSSHHIHKDGDSVGMIWDRCTREPKRQNAVKLAHIARSVSDLCTLADIRSLILMDYCEVDSGFIEELKVSYKELFDSISLAIEEFNEVEYNS